MSFDTEDAQNGVFLMADTPNTSILGGFFLTVIIFTTIVLFHILLPGRAVVGYACTDDPNKHDILMYKLNGVLTMVIGILAVMIVLHLNTCISEWKDPFSSFSGNKILVFIARRQLGLLCGSQVASALAAYYFYNRGVEWNLDNGGTEDEAIRTMSKDQLRRASSFKRPRVKDHPWYFDYYKGIGEFNPRSKFEFLSDDPIDWKICLFMCRTIMTQLMVLSAAAAAEQSNAMLITVCMWTWVSLDMLICEHTFLYTYDVVAERMGFKLIWSTLGVHPFLYNIGTWQILLRGQSSNDLTDTQMMTIGVVFILGWILTRGAQYQKYMIKTQPSRKRIFFGLMEQRCLLTQRKNDVPRQLLVSGFWGLSKHVNYLGDILEAISLGLPAFIMTGSYLPLVYPCWVVWTSIHRQLKDDAMCRKRYGNQAWDEYSVLVPYRIVPYVY